MNTQETRTNGVTPFAARDSDWQQIQDALRELRYGSVNIIVQDGVIVQVDRTEKRRLRHSATSNSGTSSSTANGQQRAC